MPHENQSVLSRVGKGLIAFGAGTTSSNIDRIRAQRDIEEQNVELGQQEIDVNQAAITRQQRQQELTNAAFSGGPESDVAAAQLSVEFPEIFENISESMGLRSQGQKNEAADFALRLRNAPFDQRQSMIDERVNTLSAAGRDAQHTASLTGQSEEDQNNALRVTELLALSPEQRLTKAKGGDVPAELATFQGLTAQMNQLSAIPEGERTQQQKDTLSAVRIKLGQDPRAVGSAVITTAVTPGLTGQVAESEETIRQRTKFAEATGASRAKIIDKGFESIQRIDTNIRNLNQAITALDAGATTGVIESRFLPTVRAATVALEQIQAQLGLDVVQAVQFGALSEGELTLALATALPTGLQPEELREWIANRQAAQRKLRDYYSSQIQFLDQDGTVAGFLRSQERQDVLRFDAEGNRVQ